RGESDNMFTPAYDKQENIYPDLIACLKAAEAAIEVSKGLPLGGDVIYKGDMMKWKKFANSLRLRLLMRISGKTETNAAAQIAELLSNPVVYPLMSSNADNFVYRYSGSLPDVFPLSSTNLRDFDFKYKSVSAFLV